MALNNAAMAAAVVPPAPSTVVQGRGLNLEQGFVETEQGFRLNRVAGQAELQKSLEEALKIDPQRWSKYRVEQVIMDPERITKTRLRIFHNGDGKPQAVITFKGENEGKAGNPKPRFEMDLPIDLEMLAKMNPGRKVSDCLGELFRFGGEGVIGKDRYKFSPHGSGPRPAGGRIFDIDLYDWSKPALEAMKPKQRKLYENLATVDVEMDPKDYVRDVEAFPDVLRPFVARTKDGALCDLTGDKRFKGRTLSHQEARGGHFSLSRTIADLIDTLSGNVIGAAR